MKLLCLCILFLLACGSVFSQNSLATYQKAALDSSAAMKAYYKTYEIALEHIPQVAALADPRISFAYGLSPIETRLGPQQAKISVTQMFPWFGTLSAKEKQAAMVARATYQEYVLQCNKLRFEVSHAWYQLYFISRSIKNTQKQVAILAMLNQLANTKFESSQGGMVDVLRFQMAIEELKAKVLLLEDQLKTSSVQFNSLLNRDATSPIIIADSLLMPKDTFFSFDSLLLNNPKLRALDANYSATEHQIVLAKKNAYPTIGVGLDYAFIGNRTDMQVDGSGSDALMPMISVSIPLYRKKYKAQKNEAALNRERVSFRKTATTNMLRANFEKAMQDYKNAQRNIVLYTSLLDKAMMALRILQIEYTTSGKSYDQLLAMQNASLTYQTAYDKAISDLYIALAYLEFLSVH